MLGDGGGDGADVLSGGRGDDIYIVYNSATRIGESASGDYDRVAAGVDFRLAADDRIELLTTTCSTGTAGVDLTGNAYAQTIVGNAGVNQLFTGGGAADELRGGDGNDRYHVYNSHDDVVETADQGYDRVYAAVSFALDDDDDIEVLSTNGAGGSADIDLTGNRLAQTIYGNAGDNVLADGGGAADVLVGYGGDDIYIIHGAGTRVVETEGHGTDRLAAGHDYALAEGASIEYLTTTSMHGTAGIDLTGNSGIQRIHGNDGANRIAGDGGRDVLVGHGGADTFVFASDPGYDNMTRIVDFHTGLDRIELDGDIFAGTNHGTLKAGYFHASASGQAQDASDHILYNTDSGYLYYDADGAGGEARVYFGRVDAGLDLQADDFLVV